MSNKHLVVSLIVIAMALWMFSGEFAHNTVTADEADSLAETSGSEGPVLVRGVKSTADARTVFLDVRGQTRANREVHVKAEVSGKIEALPGEKGRQVREGETLCRIAVDARRNEYDQAVAEMKSAQLEYDGFADLNKRGLQSEVVLAKAKAALEQARTRARQAELALEKTEIRAPFDGVVAAQPVEVGDFLSPGATCVTLIEINPMLVTGQVAEKNVQALSLGDSVTVRLITGKSIEGQVSYIGHAPDMATRTFPIEVTVANPGGNVRAGISAEMHVPVGVENVHLISPASLVLDDQGDVGVRIVDDENLAQFVPVDIVDESPEGVWVKGLPVAVNLITVGQEEVIDGELVRMDFSPITSLVSN